MPTDTSQSARFLESSYDWRSPWDFLFFVLFAGVSGFLILHLTCNWDEITFERDQMGGLVVTGIMIVGFTSFAAAQLWMIVVVGRVPSIVDERGITIGRETIAWEKIGLIFPMVTSSGFRGATRWVVGYQYAGASFLVGRRPVPGNNLTSDEYERFAQSLGAYLADTYPHVRVEHIP